MRFAAPVIYAYIIMLRPELSPCRRRNYRALGILAALATEAPLMRADVKRNDAVYNVVIA